MSRLTKVALALFLVCFGGLALLLRSAVRSKGDTGAVAGASTRRLAEEAIPWRGPPQASSKSTLQMTPRPPRLIDNALFLQRLPPGVAERIGRLEVQAGELEHPTMAKMAPLLFEADRIRADCLEGLTSTATNEAQEREAIAIYRKVDALLTSVVESMARRIRD